MFFSLVSSSESEDISIATASTKFILAVMAAGIDKLVCLLVAMVVVAVWFQSWPRNFSQLLLLMAASAILQLSLLFPYSALLEAAFGCTLGQRLVGLRVTNENGHNPSLRRAFVRESVGFFLRYIPYIGSPLRLADYTWLLISGGTQQVRDCTAGTFLRLQITCLGQFLLQLFITISNIRLKLKSHFKNRKKAI